MKIYQRRSSLFLFVFICQCFNGAQIVLCKIPLKTDAVRLTQACTHVNVRYIKPEQSHSGVTEHRQHIFGSTTFRWVVTSAAFRRNKAAQSSFCVSQTCLWLQWSMHTKGDSWQFRIQAPLLCADIPHQDHSNDPETQPWLKIKRQKGQE